MAAILRVLLVADADREVVWLTDVLRFGNYSVTCVRVGDEASARSALGQRRWHVVVCIFDGNRPPDGLLALRDRRDGVDPPLIIVADTFDEVAEAAQRLGATVCLRSARFAHLEPALTRALREADQISARQDSSLRDSSAQFAVLEAISTGRPLADVLREIVLLVERQGSGMLCSILLLDAKSERVRQVVAPSLPPALVEGIDGSVVGPREGTWGPAVYSGEVVVVEDIGTHPNWMRCRQLALPFGLRASWSSPIRAADGQMLGTLTMYYRDTCSPTARERCLVDRAGHLASIAISRDRSEHAASDSDALYRQIVDTTSIGMTLTDDQGRMVKTNAALRKFLGRDERELAMMSFFELLHSDDLSREHELADEFRMGTRTSYHADQRFVREDGAVLWGRMVVSTIKHRHEDIPGGVIVMIEDITERREIEEAVRSSDRLRALMFDAVSDPLFHISVDAGNRYRFLSVNPAFSRMTGLGEREVVGQPLEQVLPEPSLTTARANFRRAIETRRTVTFEDVAPFRAGVRYGEVSITPIFDGSGTCTHLVGNVHDVTEIRLAAQRMAAQAALLDKAHDGILVRDLDGKVRYWNKGAEKLYGWCAGEALGRNVCDLIYRERGFFDEAQRRLLETGQWSGEVVQFSKTGRELVVECSWTLITEEGAGPKVLVINTDITDRKRLEAQVLHAQRMESLGTLAAGIAHDFNNLLTVMSAGVQFALLGSLANDHVREALVQAEQAASRGAALVRQLLAFSRRDEPKQLPVNLQPIVVEALALLRVTLPAGIRLETNFDPNAPVVLADATQIYQVVMNLGTNAAHAMAPGGGLLEVRLEPVVLESPLEGRHGAVPTGLYARLSVRDTGTGMDVVTLSRVFDPFFTTKRSGEGTGLGLAIVQDIMRCHAGDIVVSSTPGRGSVFDLYFPATTPALAPESDVLHTRD